jgi:type II secretory pathway pseudopilin PulG
VRTRTITAGFSLAEILLVITIILVLAGLILSTVGYVEKKSARARAQTEIAAMSAAIESYKADNGIYPRDPTLNTATDTLDARTDGDPTLGATNPSGATYPPASLVLYRALSGGRNLDRIVSAADEALNIDGSSLSPPLTQLPKSYFTFKSNSLSPADQTQNVQYIRDPFGNSYGYSTANQADPNTPKGYNPTFDLWTTCGETAKTSTETFQQYQLRWIKNW